MSQVIGNNTPTIDEMVRRVAAKVELKQGPGFAFDITILIMIFDAVIALITQLTDVCDDTPADASERAKGGGPLIRWMVRRAVNRNVERGVIRKHGRDIRREILSTAAEMTLEEMTACYEENADCPCCD